MKKIFSVDDDFINARLDRWFKRNVCVIPQSLIEKYIRKKKIKVNNKKAKSSYKLKKNDQIYVYDFNFTQRSNNISQRYIATQKDILKSSNLFIENNKNFVVINKPAGISVQSGTKSHRNILDILRSTNEFIGTTPYTVHRIDKETTGVLIVAKNRKFAQLFTSLFRIRKIHKTYLGIVRGELQISKGTYVDDLYYYEGKKKIKTKAITHFSVIDTNSNYSLLKLNPETGRKHQLRKQLLMHGYPILGDDKYNILQNYVKRRNNLMLHAYKINFSIAGNKYNYCAELPLVFNNFLKEKYLKIF